MKLTHRLYDGIHIFSFVGEFDSFNLPTVSSRLDAVVEPSAVLVLDFNELRFINSAALGYVFKLQKKCRAAKGRLVLSSPSKFLRMSLRTLGLDQAFEIHETVADAIAAVSTSSP